MIRTHCKKKSRTNVNKKKREYASDVRGFGRVGGNMRIGTESI